MTKTKKIIIFLIIISLTLATFFSVIYFLNQAKNKTTNNQNSAELAVAKQKLALETQRLKEMRVNSYFIKVSNAEYEKAKNLVSDTDIFFSNPGSEHPEIQLKVKNKIIATDINNRRAKINEILEIWSKNGESLETDQKLLDEINTYLLIIQSYLGQLNNIVSNLSTTDSGLTTRQIDSYADLIKNSFAEIEDIINTIKEAELIINGPATSIPDQNSNEIINQIEIINEIREEVTELEEQIYNPIITPILATTSDQVGTSNPLATSTSSTTINNKVINPQNSSIIYKKNPSPFRDNGVDVNNSGLPVPLQDW